MAARNDITGDTIKSKSNTQKFRDNWDSIFRKEKEEETEKDDEQEEE